MKKVKFNLMEMKSLSEEGVMVLISENNTLYRYENGILYDTDWQGKKTTSHRMTMVELIVDGVKLKS